MSVNKMYDIRVVDRYIKRGELSKEAYEKYIKELKDGESESVAMDVRLGNEDLSEEE